MSRLDISIKNPCSENWNNFEKNGNVGFCASCQKSVIDFTKYTDQEIIEFFKKDNGNTCGRFKQEQLRVYNNNRSRRPFNKIAAVLAAGIITITQVQDVFAQSKIITGKVLDDANDAIPGTNILIKGTTLGTISDSDGNFEITYGGKDENLTLVFTFIGYEPKEQTFNLNSEKIDAGSVAMTLDAKALEETVIVVGYLCVKQKPVKEPKKPFWRRRK